MQGADTSIQAGRSAFDPTRWSLVLGAGDASPERRTEILEELARTYWRPVYRYIRLAWRRGNEDAKDLTQEFLARLLAGPLLARADPSRGSFRTYVLACLVNFLRDEAKRRRAAKRGGGLVPLPLDALAATAGGGRTPEEEFDRAWAETLLGEGLEELRSRLEARDRTIVYRAFSEYCLDAEPGVRVSYADVAARLGLTVTAVTNHLFEARRLLREILDSRIHDSLGEGGDVDAEYRTLFG